MKKIIVLTTVASLAIGLGVFSYSNSSTVESKNDSAAISKNIDSVAKKSAPSVVRTDKIEANHAIFTNADDAESQSDAVVRVIATGESKNVIENFEWGPSGRTETKVKVIQVYKDSAKQEIGSELVTFEPSYVIEGKEGSIRMNYEDYTLMQEGNEYILFLVWNPKLGGYWVNSLEQGKFEVSGTDIEEKTMQATNDQYNELKKSVLEKYKQ
ncbi:hypothetical protein JNUCC31_06790 [Paenibacillus sp. JNUCC31]|uniref:hypothetical protein n=1 Tax=Paenibacillus sp. JNUCC-31 TaxID=2777983 RepID=UPI0017857153|nr:hypothetical protein [Paenibacillus sp. JNUCC-31]QOS80602.1 hypothetical protein JNUCC31_06790 [Paenibacillus sp. JNUCC-31]